MLRLRAVAAGYLGFGRHAGQLFPAVGITGGRFREGFAFIINRNRTCRGFVAVLVIGVFRHSPAVHNTVSVIGHGLDGEDLVVLVDLFQHDGRISACVYFGPVFGAGAVVLIFCIFQRSLIAPKRGLGSAYLAAVLVQIVIALDQVRAVLVLLRLNRGLGPGGIGPDGIDPLGGVRVLCLVDGRCLVQVLDAGVDDAAVNLVLDDADGAAGFVAVDLDPVPPVGRQPADLSADGLFGDADDLDVVHQQLFALAGLNQLLGVLDLGDHLDALELFTLLKGGGGDALQGRGEDNAPQVDEVLEGLVRDRRHTLVDDDAQGPLALVVPGRRVLLIKAHHGTPAPNHQGAGPGVVEPFELARLLRICRSPGRRGSRRVRGRRWRSGRRRQGDARGDVFKGSVIQLVELHGVPVGMGVGVPHAHGRRHAEDQSQSHDFPDCFHSVLLL